MEAEPVASRWHRIVREALPILVLLAVCAKSTADGWRVYDFMSTDETVYVALAWHWSDPALVPPQEHPMYVPLYTCWYRVLLLLPVGPEYVSHVSHGLQLTMLALLFYGLVRRLGVGRWLGATAAVVLILNTRLAAITPLPVHLATVLLAAGALVGTYRRSALGACGPVGFALLAACYVRNEFGTALLALLPLYLAAGLWACRSAVGRREFLPWAVPLLLAVGACHATIGIPLPNGPRGIFAFAQHYAMNVAQATGQSDDLWVVRFRDVLAADFGEVQTFGEAVRARPGAVAWHVGCNLDRLPTTALNLLRPRLELIDPFARLAHWLIVGAVGVGLVGAFRRVWFGALRGPDGQALRALGVACVPVGMVGGASVVLIYPREHYLILPLFFILVLAVSGLPRPRWPFTGEPSSRALACAAAALLLTAAPTATHRWTVLRPLVNKWTATTPFELRETMTLLHAVERRPDVRVLDQNQGAGWATIWLTRPVHFVSADGKLDGWRAFAARHDIGVVILDRRLCADERFAGDREFMALWDETDTGSFAVLKSPSGHRIAVRRDLLKSD